MQIGEDGRGEGGGGGGGGGGDSGSCKGVGGVGGAILSRGRGRGRRSGGVQERLPNCCRHHPRPPVSVA